MYVALRTFYPKKGCMEKVLEILKEVIRIADDEAGFQGAYCLCDEKEHRIIGIGKWDSQENADNYEKKRIPGDKVSEVNKQLEELLTQPSTREIFFIPFMFEKKEEFICSSCNPISVKKVEGFVYHQCNKSK